jgi:hypothetical protein
MLKASAGQTPKLSALSWCRALSCQANGSVHCCETEVEFKPLAQKHHSTDASSRKPPRISSNVRPRQLRYPQ